MNSVDTQVSDRLRIDYSRVNQYTGPESEKPSFWNRIKKGLATFGSFAGTMTQFLGPMFGPFGIIAGAAGYGVRNVSNRALGTITSREQFERANQPQSSTVTLPGFMDGSNAVAAGGFVAPSHLEDSITGTVILREDTNQELMHSL